MINRYINAIAGTFILLSVILAVTVNVNFLWFTGFVGANLLQSAFTKWCLMGIILKKLGKLQGKKILELGCGAGEASVYFGSNPSQDQLRAAETFYSVSASWKYDLKLMAKYFGQLVYLWPKPDTKP